MQKLMTSPSEWDMEGRWRGFEADLPYVWRDTDLPEMLDTVQDKGYALSVATRYALRESRNELLKLRLPHAAVAELLNFTGPAREMAERLHHWLGKRDQKHARLLMSNTHAMRLTDRLEALKNGALGFRFNLAFNHTNRVLDGYLDTIQALMDGTAVANDTLEVQNIVVGAGYRLPAVDDAGMDNQIGSAKTPGEQITVGRQMTWITFFGLSDNNGATTTVTSGASTTVFDVTSATGLAVGDRIQVQTTSGQRLATITNIASSTITVDTALADIPANTNPVIQVWGESGLRGNANGLTQFTRSRFQDGGYVKTNQKAVLVESSITKRSVSV